MTALSESERRCLQKYVALLRSQLAGRLHSVQLFGSAARGDMWGPDQTFHSDIDVLVVTREPLADEEAEALVNETYPLYLECGRQISPQFFSLARYETSNADIDCAVLEEVARDGQLLFSSD